MVESRIYLSNMHTAAKISFECVYLTDHQAMEVLADLLKYVRLSIPARAEFTIVVQRKAGPNLWEDRSRLIFMAKPTVKEWEQIVSCLNLSQAGVLHAALKRGLKVLEQGFQAN
ncbi:hypothetical protein [Chitinophaga rhizosphaerae]|uniref:hypothetical protein n=1 Tax=Chitinophaga rhizosphaerae TaxID=1864947 RepID=UPI000F809426|nr:hypothetical protein [Chitinophaga rhizosphaerae]